MGSGAIQGKVVPETIPDDTIVIHKPREKQRQQIVLDQTPHIGDITPGEAAELYYRHFTALAHQYGFMPVKTSWETLDDATKTLHTATWREMLASLRHPKQPKSFDQLPDEVMTDADDVRERLRKRQR